jgi:hypothetical protein
MNTEYGIHIPGGRSYACSMYLPNAVTCIDNEYTILLFLHTKNVTNKVF